MTKWQIIYHNFEVQRKNSVEVNFLSEEKTACKGIKIIPVGGIVRNYGTWTVSKLGQNFTSFSSFLVFVLCSLVMQKLPPGCKWETRDIARYDSYVLFFIPISKYPDFYGGKSGNRSFLRGFINNDRIGFPISTKYPSRSDALTTSIRPCIDSTWILSCNPNYEPETSYVIIESVFHDNQPSGTFNGFLLRKSLVQFKSMLIRAILTVIGLSRFPDSPNLDEKYQQGKVFVCSRTTSVFVVIQANSLNSRNCKHSLCAICEPSFSDLGLRSVNCLRKSWMDTNLQQVGWDLGSEKFVTVIKHSVNWMCSSLGIPEVYGKVEEKQTQTDKK
jgi:hypothetical protein